jgi:hypothetical protein
MLTPVVSETLIFLVALVFNLIYHRDIQNGMLLLFQNNSARQTAKDILKDIQVNTSIYFGTLTVVNICLGIAATVLTWLVGLPHPFLWGMLAAVDKPRRSRPLTTGSSTMATTHASTTGTTTLAIMKAMTARATTNSPTTEIRTAQFQRSTESSIGVPSSGFPIRRT